MEIKLARSRKLEGVLSKPEVYKSMTTCHFQGVGWVVNCPTQILYIQNAPDKFSFGGA